MAYDPIHELAALFEHFGRNGDTHLVHVNKREMKMLKDAGGSGTINPKTGLYEFGDDTGGGMDQGGGDSGGGVGSSSGSSGNEGGVGGVGSGQGGIGAAAAAPTPDVNIGLSGASTAATTGNTPNAVSGVAPTEATPGLTQNVGAPDAIANTGYTGPGALSALGSALTGNFAPAGQYMANLSENPIATALDLGLGFVPGLGLATSGVNLGIKAGNFASPSGYSPFGGNTGSLGGTLTAAARDFAAGNGVGVTNTDSSAAGSGSGVGSPTDYLSTIGANGTTLGEIEPAPNTLNTSSAPTPTPAPAAVPDTTPAPAAAPAATPLPTTSSTTTTKGGPSLGGYPDASTYLNSILASFNQPRYI